MGEVKTSKGMNSAYHLSFNTNKDALKRYNNPRYPIRIFTKRNKNRADQRSDKGWTQNNIRLETQLWLYLKSYHRPKEH